MTDDEARRKCAKWVEWCQGVRDWNANGMNGRSDADLAEAVRVKWLARNAPILPGWGYRTPIENMHAVARALNL